MSGGIGDMQTLIGLVRKIYLAVDEVKGSAGQYQATKADFDQWTRLLKDVEEALSALPEHDDARRKVQHDVDSCYTMLATAYDAIGKYDSALDAEPMNVGKWKRLWFKIHWRVFTREKVSGLEAQQSKRMMGLLVSICLSSFRSTWKLLDSIPPHLGYTSENALVIIDGLGKQLTWPMGVCKPWTVRADEWETVVVCGMTLEMIMVLRQGVEKDRKTCPRCGGHPNLMAQTIAGWLECARCEKLFKVTQHSASLNILTGEGDFTQVLVKN
ncbi:hypothetical protein FA95DRAFT_1570745 [Auriscalpium vulgare]|uniref:Uncharacterized protein n=1 Tax=Auriscalpium vulgare TaxID=40419 RepID=A0ACB8S283_9AGAM|nr:hypothetical protein FA95DRAFT_1570745 [Auriscalpium vulgare]